jgi:hypothetical protein
LVYSFSALASLSYSEFISVLELKLRNHSTMATRENERQVSTRTVAVFIIVVLAFAGSMAFISAWMGALTINDAGGWPLPYNENDVIMQVSLDNTNPLILSVKVKSNSSEKSVNMVEAYVKNYNQTTVAEYWSKWVNHHYGFAFDPICELPEYGSEKLLTLNFETTLPSGSYTLWFCAIGEVTYSGTDATRADVERGIYPFAHVYFTIPFIRPHEYL